MQHIQGLVERVRAAGGKMTSRRALIYATLAGDVTHPTEEEVYTRLRLRLPHLSLWSSGLEMTAVGALEGAITYAVGIRLGHLGA